MGLSEKLKCGNVVSVIAAAVAIGKATLKNQIRGLKEKEKSAIVKTVNNSDQIGGISVCFIPTINLCYLFLNKSRIINV